MKHCLLAAIFLLVVACQPRQPSAEVQIGEVLLQETFDQTPGWDRYSTGGVEIGIDGSAYRMQADVNSYVRGFNRTRFEDVVIDVETTQYSVHNTNAYGVVCRGVRDDHLSNGYYFLIGADGSYSIRKGQYGEIFPLIKWARSRAINKGAAVNQIRVVCVENYLALYVNGDFVADIRDDTFGSGYIGFAVAAQTSSTVDIAFDNLTVYAASLTNP